jgi:hypothetical protein
MKRLRALDVHEISLVKSAANARKYLIRKRAEEGSMPDVQSIHEQLLAVPQTTVLAIEAVAKSAGDDDGMNEEAQAAMKAAGRILAPHADNLTSEQVTKLMQAIGMLAQDKADTDANAADAQQNANDADIKAAEGANKAAPKAGNEDQRDAEEIDEQEQEAQKADKPKWLHDKIKGKADKDDSGDADDEQDEDDVGKTGGASGPGMDLPKAKDTDSKKKFPMAKAADDAVLANPQMRYASDAARNAAPNPLESTVAKSAHLDLSGFTEAQRAALEPITKSHAALADSHRALEAAHKEAVAKSQALQHKLDRKEFVAKAAAYPHLGKADELGALMHNLHDKDPDSFAAWEGVLKTANAAQDSSALFEERGSRLSESGSAAADMDKAVAAFVQKSATGLSRDQAMDAFLKTDEGKQLYRLERAEAHAAQRRG